MNARPTLIDRMYAAVAPGRAERSAVALAKLTAARAMDRTLQQLDAGTAGASALAEGAGSAGTDNAGWNHRWSAQPRDAASDTLRVVSTQRGQSRDLVRTEPIAASAIGTKVNRAVGTGLALSAQPHRGILGWDEERTLDWRLKTHAEFSLWFDSTACDIRNTSNGYDLQALVLRSMLESGDVFTILPDGSRTKLMPYALRLQVLEADRVGNPLGQFDSAEVSGGIRRDAGGAPTECFVYDRHPGSVLQATAGGGSPFAGRWVRMVGASGRRRMLHHYRVLRPEQPRGIPDLAPVMQLFKDLRTYKEAEIRAAVVSAFVALIIETEGGGSPAPVFAGAMSGQAGDPSAQIELGPGSVIGLAKGEKAVGFNPGRPNPAFAAFIEAVVGQLGAGLLIGPEMLMKRYNTSYVAARAAFLDAWKHLLDLRTCVIRSFCQPVYETWMAEAVAIGRIAAPGFFADPLLRWAYTRAQWSGDSQGSINPKDEVKAYLDAVDGRLISRERAEWELFGTDWSETYDTKKAEHDRLSRDGMLPVPKAGAAAPAQDDKPDDEPPKPTPTEQALTAIAGGLAAVVAREPVTPIVHNHMQPPDVTVRAGDTHVTLPEGCVQLKATVEAPQVHLGDGCIQLEATVQMPELRVDVAPAQVTVPPPQVTLVQAPRGATRQTYVRDAAGELVESITTPIEPAGSTADISFSHQGDAA